MDVLCPDCEKTFPFQGEPPAAVVCPHCANSGTLSLVPPPERSQWQVEAMPRAEFLDYLATGFRPATPEALAMAEGRRKARSAPPEPERRERRPMKGRTKVVLAVVAVWLLVAVAYRLGQGDGGDTPGASVGGAASPATSVVRINHLSNEGDESVRICTYTHGPSGGSGTVCRSAPAHKSDTLYLEPIDLKCLPGDGLTISVLAVDGTLLNQGLVRDGFCLGTDHAFGVTVTAAGRIDFQPRY
ncbi:MAG: hypothetical protein QOG31_964 [Thermoplasmata archaeon]|jgi:hypothetical protein|nr:hypothetical protein [Thermoplasmata archaeon]